MIKNCIEYNKYNLTSAMQINLCNFTLSGPLADILPNKQNLTGPLAYISGLFCRTLMMIFI